MEAAKVWQQLQSEWKKFYSSVIAEPPLDLFGLVYQTEVWIQLTQNWLHSLRQLKQRLHHDRQSFGRKCPGVIVVHICTFLPFLEQRRICRIHPLWFRAISSVHTKFYLNSKNKKVIPSNVSSVLSEKYRLRIAGSHSRYHCSIVSNNDFAIIVDHYADQTYMHELDTVCVRRFYLGGSRVIQLSNQGLLIYKADLNSSTKFRIQIENAELVGVPSRFALDVILLDGPKRELEGTRSSLLEPKQHNDLLAGTSRISNQLIFWIWNLKAKKLIRIGKTRWCFQKEWRFNSNMVIAWDSDYWREAQIEVDDDKSIDKDEDEDEDDLQNENENYESTLWIWKFKDNSIIKLPFKYRIFSADVNDKNEVVVLSLENQHSTSLCVRVFQMLD